MAASTLKYQFVLFDWDGCLAQTLPIWMKAYRQAFAAFGLEPTDREIADQLGNWQGCIVLGLPKDDFDGFNETLHQNVNEGLADLTLYDGARELLEKLSQAGARMALITSSQRRQLSVPFERHNMARVFDVVISAEDVANHKPHAEPLEKALEILGGTRDQAVMIGDSDKDLGAANNAGVDSILFFPPDHAAVHQLDALQKLNPTLVCSSFADIAKVLLPG